MKLSVKRQENLNDRANSNCEAESYHECVRREGLRLTLDALRMGISNFLSSQTCFVPRGVSLSEGKRA